MGLDAQDWRQKGYKTQEQNDKVYQRIHLALFCTGTRSSIDHLDHPFSILINFYSMTHNPRLPELTLSAFSTPFSKKPQHSDENSHPHLIIPGLAKQLICSRNSKTHKPFFTQRHSLSQKNTPQQPRSILKNALKTIEVNEGKELPSDGKTTPLNHCLDTPNIRRTRSISEGCVEDTPVTQNPPRKRFFSSFEEKYPTKQNAEQTPSSTCTSNTGTSKKLRRRSSLLNELLQFPNNYDAFLRYLEQNCLNLSSVIRDKLVSHSYLKGREERREDSQPLRIMH